MTLFDGKPLTDDEVQERALCECNHPYGRHWLNTQVNRRWCRWCDCEDFVERVP